MACKNICKLCKRLIVSSSVTYDSGVLTINIPEGCYRNCEKYCLVIAQTIPDTAIINAPVVITIGTGTTTFPLTTPCCNPVVACQLRTRTKYSTIVHTTSSGGTFRLLSMPCCCPNNNLTSISETT